MTDKQTEN